MEGKNTKEKITIELDKDVLNAVAVVAITQKMSMAACIGEAVTKVFLESPSVIPAHGTAERAALLEAIDEYILKEREELFRELAK